MRVPRLSLLAPPAVVVLLALSGILLLWGLYRIEARVEETARASLERALDVQLNRVMGLLNNAELILENEAVQLEPLAPLSDHELIERWMPLLSSQPSFRSIGVADELGSDRSLAKRDRGWAFTTTAPGSEPSPPRIRQWRSTVASDTLITVGEIPVDPRESAWFGQALEERHNDPVWSNQPRYGDRPPDLHVSLLIRARGQQEIYRIIRIGVDAVQLMRGAQQQGQGYATLQLVPDGTPYETLPDTRWGRLWRLAIADREKGERGQPYQVESNGNLYLAGSAARTVKGTDLLAAALVDLTPLHRSNRLDRTLLWCGIVLITALSLVLLWSYRNVQVSMDAARKQERLFRQRERLLAKAVGERDILDREVHHRVKNNLQVVSSLLNLQLQRITDPASRSEFIRGKRRIDAMALVHHQLYALSDLRTVDLRDLLSALANDIAAMYHPQSGSISHDVRTMGVRVDPDTAIPLALAFFELVGNSYRHAFPFVTGGHISIIVERVEGDLHRMIVRDNGQGIHFDRSATAGSGHLGLEVVEALAEQLDGSMQVGPGPGASVEVTFRVPPQPPAI